MYPDYVNQLELLSGRSVSLRETGGFICPAFAGDTVATHAAAPGGDDGIWLDAFQIREMEPGLSEEVKGGWWYGEDTSVDARSLYSALKNGCEKVGVKMMSASVTSLTLTDGVCRRLRLSDGTIIVNPKDVVIANGSWMRDLLPVPVQPHKGQSVMLHSTAANLPSRVLFAQDTYIVPKGEGKFVVGSTVEVGDYTEGVTVRGLQHVLGMAGRLVPGLRDATIMESWR